MYYGIIRLQMTGDFMILNKFSEIWKSISWVLTGEKFSPRIFTDFYLKICN